MTDRVDLTDVGTGLKQYQRGKSKDGAMQPTRDDIYRWLHYHAGLKSHFTTDVDAAWVNANPEPNVLAFVEFKMEHETASFPQAVFFDAVRESVPVFIVRGLTDIMTTPPSEHRFTLERVTGLRHNEPRDPCEKEIIIESIPWGGDVTAADGLIDWESRYRDAVLRSGGRPLSVVDGNKLTDYIRGGSKINRVCDGGENR
jgi:hypothetical protein